MRCCLDSSWLLLKNEFAVNLHLQLEGIPRAGAKTATLTWHKIYCAINKVSVMSENYCFSSPTATPLEIWAVSWVGHVNTVNKPTGSDYQQLQIKKWPYRCLTLIWTRKSRKCSLKAGMSWSRLKSPWTVILIWLSLRCGNAARRRLATNSWT